MHHDNGRNENCSFQRWPYNVSKRHCNAPEPVEFAFFLCWTIHLTVLGLTKKCDDILLCQLDATVGRGEFQMPPKASKCPPIAKSYSHHHPHHQYKWNTKVNRIRKPVYPNFTVHPYSILFVMKTLFHIAIVASITLLLLLRSQTDADVMHELCQVWTDSRKHRQSRRAHVPVR